MIIYLYDEVTGEFLGADITELDPLESEMQGKDIYLMPPNATLIEPPMVNEKETVVINDDKTGWDVVEDHRQKTDNGGVIIENSGTPYWLDGDNWETPARYMTTFGALPDGALLEQPEKPLDVVKQEKLAELSSAFNNAATTAHLMSSVGFEIDANETANRNIAGLLLVLNDGDTVTFRAYDNSFHEITKEQLQIMQQEIVVNSQNLYAQKWQIEMQINNAVSKEEVDDINIEF